MGTGETTWTQSAADHVTERELGTWEDCVPSAGVEFVRAGLNDRSIPTTAAEREALRAAMGLPEEHHGATLAQLGAGITARYGVAGLRIVTDWPSVAVHLARTGTVAVVTGSMGALPAHFRRWDVTFTGNHAVACYGQGATVMPWWCDPLAPIGAYRGEPISMTALRAYFDAYPGSGAMLADVGGLWRISNMAALFSVERWKVPAGRAFYESPNGAKIGTFSAATTITSIGVPLDNSADGIDYAWRECMIRTGAMTGTQAWKFVYVKRDDLTGVPTDQAWDAYVLAILLDPSARPPGPDDTPYSEEDVANAADAARRVALEEAEAAVSALPRD